MFRNKRFERRTSSSVSPLLLAGHETISVDVDDEENLWSLSFMCRLCLDIVWRFRIWSSRFSSYIVQSCRDEYQSRQDCSRAAAAEACWFSKKCQSRWWVYAFFCFAVKRRPQERHWYLPMYNCWMTPRYFLADEKKIWGELNARRRNYFFNVLILASRSEGTGAMFSSSKLWEETEWPAVPS